jgi:hypothetical protein
MLKLLLIVMLEETAMEVTLQMYMHTHKFLESHIHHASNTQLTTSTVECAPLLIFVKIAHGHLAQLDKLVKTNAGLLTTRSIMFLILLKLLEPNK